ncbi:hypothetical protein C488_04312 [Natrinema pellirubrum DSM 15624]|uniref:Transcriptional regulator n=1 Tax=Natrinema pellirubrum (strain DSM 15624 / CIP 106293 / JCM 10476 / NCIMB 786 / 157) TaxID=797303 RepID=L0JIP1_NATP1|nr:helix-turn-helix domain-containing protein [Natrinema pellirubrum]AGB30427.1 putative transcriptional regulator [Natrinema pellirubrum DSM 15624]ELY79346.1 hypothetical protein C488_04312 [Natrinema pellirubrum DSM 15624]
MSRTTDHGTDDVVGAFLSVADLLEEPRLARLYAALSRTDEMSVSELMDALDLPQGTAYADVNRLEEAGLIEPTTTDQPHRYAAVDVDLTLTSSGTEYTITPALIDAVGRRATDDDIDAYIDRHGVGGLAIALSYAVDRERGDTTHRLMARDLDCSPIEAEAILQALRPVVQDHFDLDSSGASLADVAADDATDFTDDA